MKNNCTIIVDGNWLLMSRMSMYKSSFDETASEEMKMLAREELCDVMTRTINVVLHKLENVVDNLVFVADGFSWRKTLEKPSSRTDVAYKGNRVKESKLDWSMIFGALDDLMENLHNNGCTVTKCENTEGDDLIYYWTRRLNNNLINTIIWSTDCDLKQLITNNDNGTFTAWYNDNNGLFLHESLNDDKLDDIEFFMSFENPVLTALKQSVNSISYINPDDIVMNKIICGDSSDNIKSIILQERNDKKYRITEKVWGQLKDELGIKQISQFYEKKDEIISRLCKMKSVDNYDEVSEIFDYNRRLVHLDKKSYPENVIEQMKGIGEYTKFDIDYIMNNYKAMDFTLEDNDAMETFFKI